MSGRESKPGNLRERWIASWSVPAALQAGLVTIAPEGATFVAPSLLFTIVVIAAGLCIVTSTSVLVRSFRRDEPELAFLGLFFLAVSVLPFVHGITTPGVLYGENSATMSSAFWAIPLGMVLSAPMLGTGRIRWAAARAYRWWVPIAATTSFVIGIVLLLDTELISLPAPGSTSAIVVALMSFVGSVALSRRQLHLAEVAKSSSPLVVAAGYGFVGSSAFVWLGATPYSAGFWVAHGLDIFGVLAGTIGALVVLRRTDQVRSVIDPILAADPLAALELGVEPIVHDFVADLEAKDPITRDHVVRTAELAMAVGQELGLSARELRTLGLGALLHDVGKLDIPDTILTKPGKLDDHEYDMIKRHVCYGEEMVCDSPAIREIAPIVRGHHERIDGGGYPDGLRDDDIPKGARIVSVCDAFDAISNTRQYREGLGIERALQILADGAGTQWDAEVVEAATTVIRRSPPTATPHTLHGVGRVGCCDCVPQDLAA